MKIKDIVNRDIVNLINCDQEPIHIPGSIQPHGFLLAVDTEDFSIQFCSGNVHNYTHVKHEQLLQKHINILIGEEQFHELVQYLTTLIGNVTSSLVVSINDKKFNCCVHKSNVFWVLEFEKIIEKIPVLSAVYDQTVQFVHYMQQAENLQQLCDKVAIEIRNLTGYDRVMVYRFDKYYNGEVYAESKREDLESFFGLHYPHTDIPLQARELYIKNLLRIIVDVDYTPVPIYTIDNASNKNLDLSLSTLRSTSPIHVQYLHNMGVEATLTISLLHQGKLWGLIACHHYSPKYIDLYTRINAQLQGHFLTSQIDVRQMAEEYAVAKEINGSLEILLNQQFLPNRNSLQHIIEQPQLINLCNAAGVAILLDGVIYKQGSVPDDENIFKIANWAVTHNKQGFFSTSKLTGDFAEAEVFCNTASGIIFYALRSLQDASIIWFNPETLEEVYWAGNPEKAIEKDANGLSPRKSFEKWKQVTKCQAREWLAPELTAAANFAYALQKQVTLILLTEEEANQRKLTEALRESNSELENINWISTHDLKEPLRKIQVFSSILLSKNENLSVETGNILQKMNSSASRMQHLIESLSTYARARQSDETFILINLQEEIGQIVVELQEELAEKNGIIHIHQLPFIKGVPVLIHQLFTNLMRNALKFSRHDIDSVVNISCLPKPVNHPSANSQQLFYKVIIQDNGIGFEDEYGETIFKIFSRLHAMNEYEGSGVGLALCKKIMQIHQGYISAEGSPNNGATFTLYFPA